MTDFESLVALNLCSNIGSIRLKKLLEYVGRPKEIFNADINLLSGVSGIDKAGAFRIKSFNKVQLQQEFSAARKLGLEILTFEDDEYPLNLKHIPDFPIVLYTKGKFLPEDKQSIAIVGSRKASFYGLSNAEKFAFELSELGITIVSGMARGVDTFAHKGALKNKGRTIAVMGSGFNYIYPPENRELLEKISASGVVISEFGLSTEPKKENFPRRNRIISGLSLGVLVVEAAKTSGSLITADFALEQGREVFALPGEISSLNSFGTNNLIRQGAKLVVSKEDILEEITGVLCEVSKDRNNRILKLGLDEEESFLYNLISDEAISLDEILVKSGKKFNVFKPLLKLQTKDVIRQLPGKQFMRSN